MPRISPPARLPRFAALLNFALSRRFGKPFPTVALLGHHPAYPVPYLFIAGIYGNARTELAAQTKALATQLVAQLNGCAFCIDLGKRVAQERQLDLEKLGRVLEFRTRPGFTPAERAALEYAWQATHVTARVDDATFAELRSFYSDREILELTVAVATENFFNRLTGPLAIESQGFCAVAPRP
ncbi:carboxymuconolactone decarboxylase family protein [Deinococcus hopiensis]|uniref:Alkylhydroperoxidase AhpD family core domain-containing protein n=1 Tax=Deinococcus hopiensis KR-140 TaxID=695939 RepID=A0A1W1V8B6_9DEIO|nr:carboxymuconolactone decarboxylase family protein [Deinococcus hopiensis]SMB89592.1 alkylhydroperoxidase AhpD family core domain-containing protein [Deinococcus hopiensis KR-140]